MIQDAWRCLLVLVVIAAWKDEPAPQQPQVYNYPPQYQPVVVEDRPFQRVGRATMDLAESLWRVIR